MEHMKDQYKELRIYSVYSDNIDKNVVLYQKAVFDYFNINLNQIEFPINFTHYDMLNSLFSSCKDKYVVMFDSDCIPVKPDFLNKVFNDIKDEDVLSGIAQTANHLSEGKNIYVGPAFFGISMKLYHEIGNPPFNSNNVGDIGHRLAYSCRDFNRKIIYWYPTHIEIPKWVLYPDKMFGIGTTYEHMIYHQFNIAISPYWDHVPNVKMFIEKAKQIINS